MGGAFWVVTHGRSAKVREMKANPCVSLCSSFHTFKCKAHFMGHPLLPANQAAREALAGEMCIRDSYERCQPAFLTVLSNLVQRGKSPLAGRYVRCV